MMSSDYSTNSSVKLCLFKLSVSVTSKLTVVFASPFIWICFEMIIALSPLTMSVAVMKKTIKMISFTSDFQHSASESDSKPLAQFVVLILW